jgi:hypothetical protein
VYLISGHGSENPVEYSTRFHLPADVWVSTFQECGKEAMVYPCSFNAMKRGLGKCALFHPTKRNMMHSTIDFFKAEHLGVHRPGDPCPHMYIDLCFGIQPYPPGNGATDPLNYRLFPSGIIKFPRGADLPNQIIVSFDDMTDADIPAKIAEIKRGLSLMYEESLLPTKGEVLECYYDTIETLPGINTLPVFKKAHRGFLDRLGTHFRYFIGDIIAKFGKGIYYAHTCRITPNTNEGLIERIRARSASARGRIANINGNMHRLPENTSPGRRTRRRNRGKAKGKGNSRGRSLTRRANGNK